MLEKSIKCNTNTIIHLLKCVQNHLNGQCKYYHSLIKLLQNKDLLCTDIPKTLLVDLYTDYENIRDFNYPNNIGKSFQDAGLYLNNLLTDKQSNSLKDDCYYPSFEKELETLLNKYGIDNKCNTPDFILAKFITECLVSVKKMVNVRAKWFGHEEHNNLTDVIHLKNKH